MDNFNKLMLEISTKADKQFSPARIIQLKHSYDFFKGEGLLDSEIKNIMALTSHEMNLIKKAKIQ